MITSLRVRDIEAITHDANEYIKIPIYFSGVKEGRQILACITREIHLVKGLKVNLLIGNDFLESEGFVIDVSNRKVTISSCEITIDLSIRQRDSYVRRNVHANHTIVVSSDQEIAVSIKFSVFEDRDFLFESSCKTNVTLYHHVIDAFTSEVIVRNDSSKSVIIFKNFRLEIVIEMIYDDCFLITANESCMIMRPSTTFNWIKETFEASAMLAALTFSSSKLTSTKESFCHEDISTAEIVLLISTAKIVLLNGIMLCDNKEALKAYTELVNDFSTLWKDEEFINIPEERWMRLSLRNDWQDRISSKSKMYSLSNENKKIIDSTFDELHEKERLIWTTTPTSFSYPVFVAWKTINEIRKDRAVVDIRDLNKLLLLDAYSLPLQNDIISDLRKCTHISILDATTFFYQWKTHPDDVYKQTIVTHRGQETFLVPVMRNRNSIPYVQRQMNDILRAFRQFVKVYIDDVIVKSNSLKEHLTHLRIVFNLFVKFNIIIKSTKVFIDYSNVALLEQRVNSLKLSISEKKLKTIANIKFPETLQDLKHYLELTKYIRDHIYYYAVIVRPLQNLKTSLLKTSPSGFNRKNYVRKIKIALTMLKIKSFESLQKIISHSFILYHFNVNKPLWIDLNTFKKFEIKVVVFHLKDDVILEKEKWSSRTSILSVLFFSRQLTAAKRNYWSTKLKTFELVWTIKKIKHLVQDSHHRVIIQTNHQAIVDICEQILITSINSTLRMNIRLIRASQFLNQFNLNIKYKSKKDHIISNALSRLASVNIELLSKKHSELNILYTYNTTLIEMFEKFRKKIIEDYEKNPIWKRILTTVLTNEALEKNAADLSFETVTTIPTETDAYMKSRIEVSNANIADMTSIFESFDLLYHIDRLIELRRLCIFDSCVKDVMKIVHDNDHSEFVKCFEMISQAWYIRKLIKALKNYIKHCSKCLVLQTRRHKPWKSLQSIDTSCVSFHTITLDFILTMSLSIELYNVIMSITNKFTKRITLMSEKDIYKAKNWAMTLIERLEIVDWEYSKVIISDRDRKFLFELWKTIFVKLRVHLLYFTSYHSQTNDSSERTNQTVEIALRYFVHELDDSRKWPRCLSIFQTLVNNSIFTTTDNTSNEVIYDFTSNTSINLINEAVNLLDLLRSRIEARDVIFWVNMIYKSHYDRRHSSLFFKEDDMTLLKLHHEYSIPSIEDVIKKLTQQFVDPFKVIAKIERLTYKLNISEHWKVHPVFSIAQLELCSESNPYDRFRPDHPDSVYVESDTDTMQSYELKRLLNKRIIKRKRDHSMKYLVKWKDYGPEFDKWMNIKDLKNAKKLIDEYESTLSSSRD